MPNKATSRIILTLFLSVIFVSLTFNIQSVAASTATTIPEQDFPSLQYIFQKDLLSISKSVPQIELIYVVNYFNFIHTALIRINYTSGLSDNDKISIQDYVQQQLESKWYVNYVEPNYIFGPEPAPWPGLDIGELFVAFKDSIPVLPATVDIFPSSLNLKSKGRWITAHIELPEGYNVSEIDVSTITLNGTIQADLKYTKIGNHDDCGIPDLKVEFDRAQLIQFILSSVGTKEEFMTIALTVTGYLEGGRPFQGCDTIRIRNE